MRIFYLAILVFFNTWIILAQGPDIVWAKQMGGSSHDTGHYITTDNTGNVFTTGGFWGTADFDPGPGIQNLSSAGMSDIFIHKLDSDGNLLWVKQMGAGSGDWGRSITTDDNGNVYITGVFQGTVDFDPGAGVHNFTSAGFDDIFIQKLDSNGNFLWAKQMGSSGFDKGYSLITDVSGNVYSTGKFTNTVDFDPGVGIYNLTSFGDGDIFIQKLDSDGNFVFAKQMGGDSGNDWGYSITIDGSSNLYTTGNFTGTVDFDPGTDLHYLTSAGSFDVFIQKLDSNGNFVWAKRVGGIHFDEGYSITIDGNSNVFTTGIFQGTVDFDPNIEVQNLTSEGMFDIFIQKLNSDGNYLWAKQMGGSDIDYGRSIITDASGDVYITGNFRDTVDFDPGVGVQILTSAGIDDTFIQKLDSDGNFLWVNQVGGSDEDIGLSITIDSSGNIYATGAFQGTVDFDPGAGIHNLTSAGSYDVFIQKLNSTLGLNNFSLGASFVIYPNPSDSKFTIAFESVLSEVEVTVVDIQGRILYSNQYQNTDNINLEFDNSAGVYLVEIKTPLGKKTKSFIKK